MKKYTTIKGFAYKNNLHVRTVFGVENARLASVDAAGYASYEVDGEVVAVYSQEQHDEALKKRPVEKKVKYKKISY